MFDLPLNQLSALAVLPILLLVFIGFWPHFIRKIAEKHFNTPETWMIMFIMAMDVGSWARLIYWDIYRGIQTGFLPSISSQITNATFNVGTGIAGMLALTALYVAIPKEDRKGWNIFTAPFYPKRLRNLFQRG